MAISEDSPFLEAIALWEKLTGVVAGSKVGSWDVHDTYKLLREAVELDPSEVTASLLFQHYVKHYLAERSASMLDLMNDPEKHMAQIATARDLMAILHREEIVQARDEFIVNLRLGLARYGAGERADIEAVLAKPDEIAVLRRDALRSLEKLRVDQFLSGAAEAADVRPTYSPVVFSWWNINALLAAMTHTPSGVALNMIRDPNRYESYFAFSIRNGGNLFVLSDVPQYAHPLQPNMTRRPDRALGSRMCRNWFPYDLLGYEINEEGDLYFPLFSDAKTIVPYQKDRTPLSKIGELGPHETIWLTMMLDLIVRKFWTRGHKAPELSFTGEMLKVDDALLTHAEIAGLPAVVDQRLELQPLVLADVSTPDLDEAVIGKRYGDPNAWMEARYRDRVAPETFNLLGPPGRVLALNHASGEVEVIDERARKAVAYFDREKLEKGETKLVQLSGARFGTPGELQAERLFLARYNFAKQIDHLADEEFRARKDEVLKWYLKRVAANIDTILAWTLNETIWVDDGATKGGSHHAMAGPSKHVQVGPDLHQGERRLYRGLVRHYDLNSKPDVYERLASYNGNDLGGYHKDYGKSGYRTCVVNGAKASTVSIIYPGTPEELAAICACEVEDLPDVLQTWTMLTAYHGNCILDRIDPMVWKAQSPWIGLDLRLNIPLSKSGRAAVAKRGAQLPPLPNIVGAEETAGGHYSSTMHFGGYKG